MALVSPGVEVSVIDQSQYLPAPLNSIPLVVVATAQSKADASGTAVAAGTTAANAGKLFQVTSQRDLVNLYGSPFFYKTATGTPIQGYELNEYGLLSAYSALGITNRVYVLRADIDLGQLVGRLARPSGAPDNDTYWLDTRTSTWGIFEFNSSTGKFTAISPRVVYDKDQLSNGVPLSSIGVIGEYAVVPNAAVGKPTDANSKTYFYKSASNTWVVVGSRSWQLDIPTVQGSTSNPVLVAGDKFQINVGGTWTMTVTVPVAPDNTVYGVANLINAIASGNGSGAQGELRAEVRDGKLNLFTAQTDSDYVKLLAVTAAGNPLAALGITAGTYYQPDFVYGTASQMPLWTAGQAKPRPSGSIWLKVGAVGGGLNPVVNRYSSADSAWLSQTVNLSSSDWVMTGSLDASGGKSIPRGTLYAQFNYDGQYNRGPVYFWNRLQTGPTVVTGSKTNFTIANGGSLYVTTSVPGVTNLSATREVVVPNGATPQLFVTAWAAAGIQYTTCEVTTTGAIRITHTQGGEIILNDISNGISNGIINTLGLAAGTVAVKTGPAVAADYNVDIVGSNLLAQTLTVASTTGLSVGQAFAVAADFAGLLGGITYKISVIDAGAKTIKLTQWAGTSPVPTITSTASLAIPVQGYTTVQYVSSSISGGQGAVLNVGANYDEYVLYGSGVVAGGGPLLGASGATYTVGDQLVVSGAALGGSTPENDLRVEVTRNNQAEFSAAIGTTFSATVSEAAWTGTVTTAIGGVGSAFINDGLSIVSTTAGTTMVVSSVTNFGFAVGQHVGGTVSLLSGVTAGLVIGQSYVISDLGTTTQAEWNTLAGTTTVVYAVGDIFNAAAVGAGAGTGKVSSTVTTNTTITALQAPAAQTITAVTDNTTSFTVTCPGAWIPGMQVTIAGVTPAFYNGTWTINSTDGATAFTVVTATGGAGVGTAFGTALGLATGGIGHYTVSASQFISSTTMQGFVATLNVTSVSGGIVVPGITYLAGQVITGTGVLPSTLITSAVSGTGGVGTYRVSRAQTVNTTAMLAAKHDTTTADILTVKAISAGKVYDTTLPTFNPLYEIDGVTASVYGTVNTYGSISASGGPATTGTGSVGSYVVTVPGAVVKTEFMLAQKSDVMTVSAMAAGTIKPAQVLSNAAGSVAYGTVTAYGTGATTGTGGVGTYTLTTVPAYLYPGSTVVGDLGTVGAITLIQGTPATQYTTQLSNWVALAYTAQDIAPVKEPAENAPWFYSTVSEIDIMVCRNNGNGQQWIGYRNTEYDYQGHPIPGTSGGQTDPNGPIVTASAPTTQSDGTPLQWGDLWIDSGDLENYPVIRRWQRVGLQDTWVLINNADQVSSSGITFNDARWAADGTTDPINDPIPAISGLLTSNYLDLDAPSAQLFPQGMLLWNTRRSGYNVKKWDNNRFNAIDYPGKTLPAQKSTWVSASGLKTDGSPYMGRKAQRAMVVAAMRSVIDTNTEIRDEDNAFNLIAAPNYPELQPNMVALNAERGYTGYIIGDTPLRLKDSATDIQAWATNAAGATSTGEDGCVTRDTYLGLFYPSGITTDLSGAQVVVPASHMMLRTFLRNDSVAYPWLAAAGTRRGIIDNATNIGYLEAATGEFKTIKTRVGIRDVLYQNFINPLVFFTGQGLLNYGNKTSFNSQSALDRTNVARLVAFIRRQLAIATRPFIFEPNDAITRTEVQAVVQTLFVDLVSKRGIYDYLVVCDQSNNTPARIDRNELWVDVAIEPIKALEFIYIPLRILNTGELSGGG